ncbi:MAG: hypothetical protein ACUVQY_11025 [Thermoproteota archaeon]
MTGKNPIMVEAGKKAAKTRKWRRAQKKAHATYVNTKTFTKWNLSKKGFKSITFESKKGFEYKGIVDLVAVRRNNKKPDELEIVLFQMKGGNAKITEAEIERLKKALNKVKISWNIAEKKDKTVRFYKRLL